jgi:hypothetical protein
MSYDEEQQRRSRVVVETPTARREEYSVRTTRVPDRDGYSTGVIAAVALVAIAATALIMFFLMNRGDATNTNVNVTAAATPLPTVPTPYPTPPPAVVMPPMQQAPPIIVQQPPPTTTAPVVVTAPPPTTTAPAPPDDAGIETKVNKALTDDPDLGSANITVTVINGSATLIGSVKTPDLKARAERLAHAVKGVKAVDNKIMVEGTP